MDLYLKFKDEAEANSFIYKIDGKVQVLVEVSTELAAELEETKVPRDVQEYLLENPDAKDTLTYSVNYKDNIYQTTNDKWFEVVEQEQQVFKYRNTDVVGIIYKPTGILLEDDVPEITALDGYHVNIRLLDDEDATDIVPFAVQPKTPTRVWC